MPSKKTATEKTPPKTRAVKKATSTPPRKGTPKKTNELGDTPFQPDDLVVFAFRLTRAERDQIHQAAGPAKASRFVRSLAVAAAGNDETAIKATLKGLQQPT